MKAIIKNTGLEVYVREDVILNNQWNKCMIAVSKQPKGDAVFGVEKENLEIIKDEK